MALEARGIDNAAEHVGMAAPAAVAGAITWWDAKREGGAKVGPGLLAKAIREGGRPEHARPADEPTPSAGRKAAEDLWERILESLRPQLPETVLAVWLKPLWPVSLNGSVLYLEAPAEMRGWVVRRFAARLTSAGSDLADIDRIEFVTRKWTQQ